jgi:hypothetical protein
MKRGRFPRDGLVNLNWRTKMADSTIKKVSSQYSPQGNMGQKYLASGKHLSMRLWEQVPSESPSRPSQREYETVGYALEGQAE